MMLRLKDLRDDSDKTQQQIAQVLSITQRTYSYYETGQHTIPLNLLCELADYYHTSVDYLLGRTYVKKPYPKE